LCGLQHRDVIATGIGKPSVMYVDNPISPSRIKLTVRMHISQLLPSKFSLSSQQAQDSLSPADEADNLNPYSEKSYI